jgi:hypothetical protein
LEGVVLLLNSVILATHKNSLTASDFYVFGCLLLFPSPPIFGGFWFFVACYYSQSPPIFGGFWFFVACYYSRHLQFLEGCGNVGTKLKIKN